MNLIEEPADAPLRYDGAQRFDAAIEVAGHQIGRRDIDGRLGMRQNHSRRRNK